MDCGGRLVVWATFIQYPEFALEEAVESEEERTLKFRLFPVSTTVMFSEAYISLLLPFVVRSLWQEA